MEQEKKREKKEVKPNYRVGNKKELLILLHKLGVIPFRSLRLLTAPARPRILQQAIYQMERDHVVKIEKRGNEKIVMLQNTELQRKKYQEYLPALLIDYYNDFSNRNLWRTSEKDVVGQVKVIRDTDAQMFFYACRFQIGPDAKDISKELIEMEERSYYSSRELKRLDGYNDGKASSGKKISASRVNGMMLADSGAYAVYNLGNQMIEWRRFSEVKLSTYITELMRKRSAYEQNAKIPKEAIVLATTDKIFHQICELNYEKNKTYRVTYMNIDYVYDSIYAVPEDINGKLLIDIMSSRGWKYRIKQMLLRPEYIEDQKFTTVPCDGYDQINDVYILIFCIPDLVKLKSYVARANLEGNKKKYRVYCYSYQIPLLVTLAGTNIEILRTDINKFHDKYFSEKMIDSG